MERTMKKTNVIAFRKPIICGICSKKEFPIKEQKYFVFSKATQEYDEKTVCSFCVNREEKKYEYKLEA
jgi:hypothetical protein